MKRNNFLFSQDLDISLLKKMKGIHFTEREMDVMACLLSGRGTSKIATFLSISPKTVVHHIQNIMKKIPCHSREGIIDFIEKSHTASLLRNHYSSLIIHAAFETTLKDIGRLFKDSPIVKIYFEENAPSQKNLLSFLETHLKQLGLTLFVEGIKSSQSFSQVLTKQLKNHRIICIVLQRTEEAFRMIEALSNMEKENRGHILFVFQGMTNKTSIFNVIDLKDNESYYLSFFDVLQKLFPDLHFQKIIDEFKDLFKRTYQFAESSSQLTTEAKAERTEEKITSSLDSSIFPKKIYYIGIGLICFCLLIAGPILLTLKFRGQPTHVEGQNSIRPDIILTNESALLNRPELTTEIHNKLKEQKGIKTIALVGIGGAGKTTLARQYVQNQKTNLSWEINAETKDILRRSFEGLADALAESAEEKRTLAKFQEITSPEEREDKIISFVNKRLKKHSNWILIYDNVEQFEDIEKYFPIDETTWGDGIIIFTTRDENIQINKRIKNAVKIGELNNGQKKDLFTRIMNKGSPSFPISNSPRELDEFLDKIPAYPLDISTAAYYLKTTHISYKEYLDNLKKNDKDFADVQEILLNDSGDYNKTRYGIIILSLQKLIEAHKEFGDLMLFVSLLDSQHIPRALLTTYKPNLVIDNFLYHLKKYSLFTHEAITTSLGPTLSIHRSTQAIALAYLMNNLSVDKKQVLSHEISTAFRDYIKNIIDEEDFSKMKLIFPHCKAFLTHANFLTDADRGSLEIELGALNFYIGSSENTKKTIETGLSRIKKEDEIVARALVYLGTTYKKYDLKKAKELLEKSLSIYHQMPKKNYVGIVRALTYLGGIYETLEDYKRAKDLLEQNLDIYKNHLPHDDMSIARAYSYLGIVNRKMGNYETAKKLLERSIVIYEKRAATHIGITQVLVHLGHVHFDLGDYKAAQQLFQRSLQICEQNFPEQLSPAAWGSIYLGNAYIKLGEYGKAKTYLEKALSYYLNRPSQHVTRIADIWRSLADISQNLGDYEESRKLLEKSLALYKKHFSESHGDVAETLVFLADAYTNSGNPLKAKTLAEQAMEIYDRPSSRNNFKRIHAKISLAHALKGLGYYKEAEVLLKQNAIVYETHYGKENIETAYVLKSLGQIYLLMDKFEFSETYLKKSLGIFEKYKHPDVYMILEDLSEVAMRKSTIALKEGNSQDARIYNKQGRDYLFQALKLVKSHFPKDSPHQTRVQSKINSLM